MINKDSCYKHLQRDEKTQEMFIRFRKSGRKLVKIHVLLGKEETGCTRCNFKMAFTHGFLQGRSFKRLVLFATVSVDFCASFSEPAGCREQMRWSARKSDTPDPIHSRFHTEMIPSRLEKRPP